MKVKIDIRAQRALSKRYWRDTRKLLAIIREPVNELSEHTDPARLKERVPFLLKPELMEKHLINLWTNVGGKFGYEMEQAIKKAKSGDPAFELKEERRNYWNERSMQLAAKRAGEKAVKILDSETEAINRVIDMVIEKANVEGMGIPETRRLMRDFLMGDEMATIENYQAERIARTEVGSASNTMSFQSAQENAEGVTKGWLTSGRTKIRDSHILYGSMGDRLAMNYEYAPGLKFPQDPDCQIAEEVINCYTGDMEIKSIILSAQRSFYAGKIIEIITDRGKRITVTPNHNILTSEGWIRAQDISIGNNLICNTEQINIWNIMFGRRKNINNKKPFIEEIFHSLNILFTSKTRPVIHLDFDNDGQFMNGNITVIDTNRELPESSKFFIKDFGKFGFKHSRAKASLIKRFCSFNFGFKGMFCSPNRLMGFLYLSFPYCFRHFRPFNLFTIGLRSYNYTIFNELASQGYSYDSIILRNLIKTYPRFIHLDKVIDIRNVDYTGHVYDFKSLTGTNIVNNIYTSNCRCTHIFNVD